MGEVGTYFLRTYRPKMRETGFRFLLAFKNFMPHIEIVNFCQNHWSLSYILNFFSAYSYLDSLDAITILIKTQVQWPALEDQIRV